MLKENKSIPSDATHEWQPNDGYRNPGTIRLRFYKKDVNNEWLVFSDVTGWRKTTNPQEWFDEETKLGFFKDII